VKVKLPQGGDWSARLKGVMHMASMGVQFSLGEDDDGHYLDVAIPAAWDAERRLRIEDAILWMFPQGLAAKPGTAVKLLAFLDCEQGGVEGEWLWARVVGPGVAKIDNVPFGAVGLCLGDTVRFNDQMEILEVLERGARTRRALYSNRGERKQVTRRWRRIKQHLAKWGIVAEGSVPGACSLAVPRDVSDDDLARIAAACPVALRLV
jgi:hypothetical protein